MQNKLQLKNASWLIERPIAHRGLHGIDENGDFFPENSLIAFQRAIDKNYSIEFDLQVTKDDEVIILHDVDLKRVCNSSLVVKDAKYDQLKKLKLFNTDYSIPTFDEALKFIAGQVPIVIELKSQVIPGVLEIKVFERLLEYEGKFSIQSFQPATVYWLKNKKSKFPIGLIGGNEKLNIFSIKSLIIESFGYATILRPDYIAFEHRKLRRYKWLGLLRKYLRIPILAWTVKSRKEYARIKNDVDNIIFEKFEA